ncbi:MAG: tRNA (cytidine(34)-2'-O)-methyltransferase [Hyphomicrobiales bacterium]
MDLALYQPDIPQNTGTVLRLGACLGVAVHIIEPAGFHWSDRGLKRAGMDYAGHVEVLRHASFERFLADRPSGRLVLLTTRARTAHTGFGFRGDDVLLLGRESAGVPDAVHAAADARIAVPMAPGMRSLNVAVAAAMVLGEGLRQTGGFASIEP